MEMEMPPCSSSVVTAKVFRLGEDNAVSCTCNEILLNINMVNKIRKTLKIMKRWQTQEGAVA
eukprot:764792-Hanusia_phi.AAC.2